MTATLCLARPGSAAFSNNDAGTTAAQFLKLGADARAAGMGEAVRALCEDANAVYWNPAGLASLDYRHITATHGAYYQGVFYDFLAYAQPVDSIVGRRSRRDLETNQLGAVGAGVLYLNSGSLASVDNTGASAGGSFTPQDFAAMVAWGGSLASFLDAGLGFKYIASRIQGTAQTGAADFGLRLHAPLGEMPYTLALSVQNLGGRLKFDQQSDPLPVQAALSQSLRPTRHLALTADVVAPLDNRIYPAFGMEYRSTIGPNLSAAARVGWEGRTATSDLSTWSGLGAGGGLTIARFTLDYAWMPYGLLGDTQRFTLSYRF